LWCQKNQRGEEGPMKRLMMFLEGRRRKRCKKNKKERNSGGTRTQNCFLCISIKDKSDPVRKRPLRRGGRKYEHRKLLKQGTRHSTVRLSDKREAPLPKRQRTRKVQSGGGQELARLERKRSQERGKKKKGAHGWQPRQKNKRKRHALGKIST